MLFIQDTEIKIINGDGEELTADAVALESVDGLGDQDDQKVVLSRQGNGHQYTIMASLALQGTLADAERVRKGYKDVLYKAAEVGARSLILIPFGYERGVIPAIASAKVLAQELLRFIRFGKHRFEKVYVCVTDTEHFEIFKQNLGGYIIHVQDTLGLGPYVTVDAIIELAQGIVIIERSNPPYGWALPGGFVDYGESLEQAVVREVQEETGLRFVDFRQMKVYSDPGRDPRFHTVSTVFAGRGEGQPKAADDAKNLKIIGRDEVLKLEYAFDHKKVIEDYLLNFQA
ncbi:MAG TPA: NUDIX hydrolase [Candidatus Omnitrophota bacterium]|nr:NUDIX hydrolase [Candidatus Omnitrophota bacterium]